HRFGPEVGHQAGGAGEEQVPGEYGHRVPPHFVGTGGAAAHRGGVHHVVVVQRGQVGQLHGDGGGAHLVVDAAAQVAGEQHQHRADAFASGLEQVLGTGVDQPVGAASRLDETPLDLLELGTELSLEALIPERKVGLGHSRNLVASAARSSSGPGSTPSRMVPSTHTATATVVNPSVRTTVAAPPSADSFGGVKNITTITRT